MQPKIKLEIEEEYGYRYWIAYLDKAEYDELIYRWETIRGLNCLVPVQLIIPQVVECEDAHQYDPGAKHCHIHECDDSWLEGSKYKIPKDETGFYIEGRLITEEEMEQFRN